MRNFKIKNREIGTGHPVFIIAEISGNHNHDINRAKKLIDVAAESGADAVKMQTYTPDTMTIDCRKNYFIVKGKEEWNNKSLYELYGWAYTPWKWQADLKQYTESKGIIWFSTPFDVTAVDFLEQLDVPLYKISSFEINHTPLLKRIAKTKKPVMMSRGMATEEEINYAIKTLKDNGTEDIILLHCISAYPAKYSEMNLRTISDIPKRYGVYAGLSDHSLENIVPIISVAQGAVVVEKHFTLKRSDGGPDASFSLEAEELAEMVKQIRITEKSLGRVNYDLTKGEKGNKIFRQSVFVIKDIKKGDILSEQNIRVIRPGYGLEPKYYEKVLGSTASKDLYRGDPLSEEDFDE